MPSWPGCDQPLPPALDFASSSCAAHSFGLPPLPACDSATPRPPRLPTVKSGPSASLALDSGALAPGSGATLLSMPDTSQPPFSACRSSSDCRSQLHPSPTAHSFEYNQLCLAARFDVQSGLLPNRACQHWELSNMSHAQSGHIGGMSPIWPCAAPIWPLTLLSPIWPCTAPIRPLTLQLIRP